MTLIIMKPSGPDQDMFLGPFADVQDALVSHDTRNRKVRQFAIRNAIGHFNLAKAGIKTGSQCNCQVSFIFQIGLNKCGSILHLLIGVIHEANLQ